MPAALTCAIRVAAPIDHGDDAGPPRNHAQQADPEQVLLVDTQFLDDGRHPESDRVEARRQGKVDQRKCPDATILERVSQFMTASELALACVVMLDTGKHQVPLLLSEPGGA